MAKACGKINLREPGFLLWLGQFVGQWKLEGEVQVCRREDGFLEALSLSAKFKKVPLGSVFRDGQLVKRAQSPLGPPPVVLSEALMYLWLVPEEFSRLRHAWHVSSGMALIQEAIEKRIGELPQAERDRRWLAWWAAGATRIPPESPPLSSRESAAHRMLYSRYRCAADTPPRPRKRGVTGNRAEGAGNAPQRPRLHPG